MITDPRDGAWLPVAGFEGQLEVSGRQVRSAAGILPVVVLGGQEIVMFGRVPIALEAVRAVGAVAVDELASVEADDAEPAKPKVEKVEKVESAKPKASPKSPKKT